MDLKTLLRIKATCNNNEHSSDKIKCRYILGAYANRYGENSYVALEEYSNDKYVGCVGLITTDRFVSNTIDPNDTLYPVLINDADMIEFDIPDNVKATTYFVDTQEGSIEDSTFALFIDGDPYPYYSGIPNGNRNVFVPGGSDAFAFTFYCQQTAFTEEILRTCKVYARKLENLAILAQDIIDNDREINGITFHALNDHSVHIEGRATATAYMTAGNPQYNLSMQRGRYIASTNMPKRGTSYAYLTSKEYTFENASFYKGKNVTVDVTEDVQNVNIQVTIKKDQVYDDDVWFKLFKVDTPCTEISLNTDTITASEIGDTVQLTPTLTPAYTTDRVSWASSDPLVASVDADGLVTVNGNGNVTITATCGSQTATASGTINI